jgi:hypothetical protein
VRDRLGGDWRALAESERNIEVEWGVTTPNTYSFLLSEASIASTM